MPGSAPRRPRWSGQRPIQWHESTGCDDAGPCLDLLIGHVVASLVRDLIATAVVLGVGVLLGFHPTGGLLRWLGAISVRRGVRCWPSRRRSSP